MQEYKWDPSRAVPKINVSLSAGLPRILKLKSNYVRVDADFVAGVLRNYGYKEGPVAKKGVPANDGSCYAKGRQTVTMKQTPGGDLRVQTSGDDKRAESFFNGLLFDLDYTEALATEAPYKLS